MRNLASTVTRVAHGMAVTSDSWLRRPRDQRQTARQRGIPCSRRASAQGVVGKSLCSGSEFKDNSSTAESRAVNRAFTSSAPPFSAVMTWRPRPCCWRASHTPLSWRSCLLHVGHLGLGLGSGVWGLGSGVCGLGVGVWVTKSHEKKTSQ